MNAATLAELTNNADEWFEKFFADFERTWNARPATEQFELDPETEQLLMELQDAQDVQI